MVVPEDDEPPVESPVALGERLRRAAEAAMTESERRRRDAIQHRLKVDNPGLVEKIRQGAKRHREFHPENSLGPRGRQQRSSRSKSRKKKKKKRSTGKKVSTEVKEQVGS